MGDETLSGLLEFAEKYKVTGAHFAAIGAVNGATLGGSILGVKCTRRSPSTVSMK
jgi:predicted DNA-binding protein with PD1-like motif